MDFAFYIEEAPFVRYHLFNPVTSHSKWKAAPDTKRAAILFFMNCSVSRYMGISIPPTTTASVANCVAYDI